MVGDVSRRGFDLLASAVGLTVLSPILAAIGVLVKLDSPGPVFHIAERVGQHGRTFRLYKFRTMAVGSDRTGPAITTAADARITRTGRFLRRTKLDELPQLFNVLKGDMSLVGPRPESPHYVRLYTPAQREVLRARPGITSAASLEYRDEAALLTGADWETRYIAEIMPRKLSIELEYLAGRTLVRDLQLMMRTILLLLPVPRVGRRGQPPGSQGGPVA
jgi:lipopolysaccharide/colanic/teichoic acid biosynthesis glycosyltransferase